MEEVVSLPPCYLFSLPQELVDIIFDHAYKTTETTYPDSLVGWYPKTIPQPRDTLKTKPNMLCIEKMIVSKRFLHEAARAYIKPQWVDALEVMPESCPHKGCKAWSLDWTLLSEYAEKLYIEDTSLDPEMVMKAFPRLKMVYLLVPILGITVSTAEDEQLMQSESYQMASSLRGLRSMKVVPDSQGSLTYVDSLQVAERIEALARDQYTRPRAPIVVEDLPHETDMECSCHARRIPDLQIDSALKGLRWALKKLAWMVAACVATTIVVSAGPHLILQKAK